jgi:hypothetical protein
MARGRVHKCVHCKPFKVSAGEKANMEAHVLRMHVPSFNVLYMCRLWGFKCTKLREFTWHTDHFKEHLLRRQKSGDTFDQAKYMEIAAQPYEIQEGKDLVRWSREDSEMFWWRKDELKKKKEEETPVEVSSGPTKKMELASPRKLQPQVRNILDEIFWGGERSARGSAGRRKRTLVARVCEEYCKNCRTSNTETPVTSSASVSAKASVSSPL